MQEGDKLRSINIIIPFDGFITHASLLENNGEGSRRSVTKALNICVKQTDYLLKTWVKGGILILEGKGCSADYTRKLRK